MIAWLIGSRIGRWVSAALAFAGVVLGAFLMGRREGKQTAKAEAQEDDYENAADIRDRVGRNLADELRKHDDSGFRD